MATKIIGTGTGTVNQNGGTNPGDILVIAAGTYSGGNFANLPGVTIDASAATFNGTVFIGAIDGSILKGFSFLNVTGTGLQWNGTFTNVQVISSSFVNVNGASNDASGKVFYNGTDASLKFNNVVFDNVKHTKSGMLLQGTFGGASATESFMRGLVVKNLTCDHPLGSGTIITGVFFDAEFYNWNYNNTGAALNGDAGLVQMNGNLKMHHINRTGGPGYLLRIWNCGLHKIADTYFYDNLDINTSDYGTVDTRIDPTQFGVHVSGSNFHGYNNTSGNKGNTINYWSSQFVVGDYPAPYVAEFHNNVGFNLTTTTTAGTKPKIIMNQGQGWVDNASTDSNNVYFDSASGAFNTTTWAPISTQLIGKGMVTSLVTDDLYHNPRGTTNDIGAVQSAVVIAPPTANAGSNQSITLPTNSVTLNGSGTGTSITFAWTQTSGPNSAVIASPANAATVVSGLVQGTYQFQLKVTDSISQTAVSTVSVTVAPQPNIPPVSNAGVNQTIVTPVSDVVLDGSSSVDPDGSIVSYAWSLVSGDATSWITNPNTARTAVVNLKKGAYVFQLVVTDNKGATGASTVTINVVDPAPIPATPVATFAAAGVTYTVFSDGSVTNTIGLK